MEYTLEKRNINGKEIDVKVYAPGLAEGYWGQASSSVSSSLETELEQFRNRGKATIFKSNAPWRLLEKRKAFDINIKE